MKCRTSLEESSFVTFVKYVNERGEAKTIPWSKRPSAEDITKKLLELLANCNLSKNCTSRFVSDGA